MLKWGIDLGGTKIEGIVLGDINQVLARKRVPTEAHNGMTHILKQIQILINSLAEEVGSHPTSIGIGTPGTLDPATGLLKNSNTQAINNKPFYDELAQALNIPVRMANDANCFALAETVMGAVSESHPDAGVVFGVIIGTGVGGGIVIDGKVLNGRQGIAGEWGHTFLDESAGKCYCGDSGCVERILSGPALEAYYAMLTGSHLKLPDIYSQYLNQDAHATQVMERLLHFYGLALANVINILDPDVIVIGGGVGNVGVLYTEGYEMVKKHVFNHTFITPIIPPLLGDSAGVFGAALL